jgi:hypothetical protein
VKSPLYGISGGKLSVDVSKVEAKLRDIFNLTKRWNAIVLLDEADVVMSGGIRRSLRETLSLSVSLHHLFWRKKMINDKGSN